MWFKTFNLRHSIPLLLVALFASRIQATRIQEQQPLHSCVPGFGGDRCAVCLAPQYTGIYKCNSKGAFLLPGYWIGLCNDSSICTGHCPLGFCPYKNESSLPSEVNELEHFVCGDKRRGVLCGQCRENFSISYHSYTYQCVPNTLCHLGWLFYIVSELLPLTIVFILVMVCNISFTSGALNGFILFAQLQDSLAVHGNGVIRVPQAFQVLVALQWLIYRFFNFDFFSIEELSFCLWRHATVLDAMAFKYVTIVYSLVLVVICVFVLNSWRVKKLLGKCIRPKSLRATTIHGLTTFFVMSYSQCARVSVHIFIPAYLYSEGPHFMGTVLFRSGHLEMFELEHLKYALPAIPFILLILVPPPLMLILYPLSYKLLALCKLSESKAVNCISKYIPMQLFDSFQSCFKDNFRFFAGLYFLYRLFTLVAFACSRTLTEFFTVLEVFLIVILAVHSLAQPYKKWWHNLVDSLLLANLAIINAITLYNFNKATQGANETEHAYYLTITTIIQLIFIYLPLVCIAICCVVKIFMRIKRSRATQSLMQSLEWRLMSKEKEVETDLPPLRGEEETELYFANYKRLTGN